MKTSISLVVTSIAKPTPILRRLAKESQANAWSFILIGDAKSPSDFVLEGCDYYDVPRQLELGLKYAQAAPLNHYARKNIGYILAARAKSDIIVETDDDNSPLGGFWKEDKARIQNIAVCRDAGWVNAYRYFSDSHIWPRGFPLDLIGQPVPRFDGLPTEWVDCPIQQGLADANPDVDAIYRLVCTLPQSFRVDRRIAFSRGSWCPFNSQNTAWWRDAYPLLYLPTYCSFRMTDIWRSFVAQRIAWENRWSVLFHEPTMMQERNEHNLMKDFEDEVVGYLKNKGICDALGSLRLREGPTHLAENMILCYEKLIGMGLFARAELDLLTSWLSDMGSTFE
jgi:hypothetical protein